MIFAYVKQVISKNKYHKGYIKVVLILCFGNSLGTETESDCCGIFTKLKRVFVLLMFYNIREI